MTAEPPDSGPHTDEAVQHDALGVVDIAAAQRAITDDYRNLVLLQVNSHCMRLAVFHGTYPWHSHPQTDELFLVVEGRLEIDLDDGRTLALLPWQSAVVPAGVVHRTRAIGRTVNLTVETTAAETVFVD